LEEKEYCFNFDEELIIDIALAVLSIERIELTRCEVDDLYDCQIQEEKIIFFVKLDEACDLGTIYQENKYFIEAKETKHLKNYIEIAFKIPSEAKKKIKFLEDGHFAGISEWNKFFNWVKLILRKD
jgi:hypothetical protein